MEIVNDKLAFPIIMLDPVDNRIYAFKWLKDCDWTGIDRINIFNNNTFIDSKGIVYHIEKAVFAKWRGLWGYHFSYNKRIARIHFIASSQEQLDLEGIKQILRERLTRKTPEAFWYKGKKGKLLKRLEAAQTPKAIVDLFLYDLD